MRLGCWGDDLQLWMLAAAASFPFEEPFGAAGFSVCLLCVQRSFKQRLELGFFRSWEMLDRDGLRLTLVFELINVSLFVDVDSLRRIDQVDG